MARNARLAIKLVDRATQLRRWKVKRLDIKRARHEIVDAIRVLREGHPHADDAVPP